MPEPLYARVRRVIAASVGDAVDAMERSRRLAVMREALREVDRAVDDVRAEKDSASARRLQAMHQARKFRDQLAALDEKARFALAADRDDLAEAAISRQLDFEAQADQLQAVQNDAADEEARLDVCLAALRARRAQMADMLASFEAAHRETTGTATAPRTTERRVERAEDAFDRAMAGAGGVAGLGRAGVEDAAKVAEITTLQRSALASQRLAALRAAKGG